MPVLGREGLAIAIALLAYAPPPSVAPNETSPPEPPATEEIVAPASPEPAEPPASASAGTEPVPPPSKEPETTQPVEPEPPDAAPIASRWSTDESGRESFGYVCVWYGGGKPRCNPSRLETIAAWILTTSGHRDARKTDRIVLHRRRGPVVPVRGAPPLPPAEPIRSSDLTIRELVSDGVHFWFIELDGWLLEATSCDRHAERVRAVRLGLQQSPPPELRLLT